VVRDGRVIATPVGGTHYATPGFDAGVQRLIDANTEPHMRAHPRYGVIGNDELCSCCNGGRLLPAACFPARV
jgi:formylmethanofuran dehydrogenase subunit A